MIQSKSEDYPFRRMLCEILLEENDTLGYLLIKKGSSLHYYPELYEDFLNFIAEKMITSNIMLYLFDTDYKKSIKEFVELIKKIKTLTFKEDKNFLISKGLREIKAIKSEMSMTIEESNDDSKESDGRIDYADRGFLLNCIEGEQLFEFIKPQQGK